MSDIRDQFENAVEALAGTLIPLTERETPEKIGLATSSYVSGDVWQAADKAVDAGMDALPDGLEGTDVPTEYIRLYHLAVAAKEITGSADPHSSLSTLHSLYYLLEDGLQALHDMRHREDDARGRFVVGTIPESCARMLGDCGIEQGDEIIAPEGFPETLDSEDAPTVEHHRVRVLHPNVAWYLRESGVLRVPTPGT